MKLSLMKLLAPANDSIDIGSTLGRSYLGDAAIRLDENLMDSSRGSTRPSVLEMTRASLRHFSPKPRVYSTPQKMKVCAR